MAVEPRLGSMRARTKRLVQVGLAITVVSALVGMGFGIGSDRSVAGNVQGLLLGALDGGALTVFEIGIRDPVFGRLRRMSLVVLLVLRMAAYGAVFLGALVLTNALLAATIGMPNPGIVMRTYLLDCFAIAGVFNVVTVLRLLFGGRTLVSLFLGRYRTPREEERVVLFLDLRGSTNLAERIGAREFHRFLNRMVLEISDPLLESGGEIYRYVGDEIIVTWPATGASAAAAISCVFAIERALAAVAPNFVTAFGAEPHLRAALHTGTLIVGEMGDMKREIVMLGDTMNTTARIEDACRTTGSDFVASAMVLQSAGGLPADVSAKSLGRHALRGKDEEIELFALTRAPG